MVWNVTKMRGAGALLAGLMVLAVPAQGQGQEAIAPRVTVPGGTLVDRAVHVTGSGQMDNRDDPPLRTPQPLVEPSAWFSGSSALAAAHRADPLASKFTSVTLDIAADGTITQCRYGKDSNAVIGEAALCADIAGQRFLPQLANDGTRVAGQFRLNLGNAEFNVAPDAPARPMFTNKRDPRPAPMPMPAAERINRFPPFDFDVYYLYREPQWRTAPRPGWGDTPQDTPKTGLIVHRSQYESAGPAPLCRVLSSSGDTQRDAAACTYARTELAPDWSAVEGKRGWMVPLYILHRPDSMIAIGPDPAFVRETQLADGADAALVAALTRAGVLPKDRAASPLMLSLASTPEGAVRHCRVVRTTGNDAQDIAACTIARETVRLMPFEDVFGTPNPLASLFWRANPAEQ